MRKFDGSELLIATHNQGKLEEIADLLSPFGVAVSSNADHGLPEPEETETTFTGNARIKAHAAVKATGLPALSDDSGITVDGLGGAPGVYTADWAETPDGRDFVMAMTRTWNELEAANAPEPRLAQFRCCLVLAWPDGHDEVFEGIMPGRLVWPMRCLCQIDRGLLCLRGASAFISTGRFVRRNAPIAISIPMSWRPSIRTDGRKLLSLRLTVSRT